MNEQWKREKERKSEQDEHRKREGEVRERGDCEKG